MRFRHLAFALYAGAAALVVNPASPLVVAHAYAKNTLSADVGAAYNDSKKLAAAGQYRAAYNKLKGAEDSAKSDFDRYAIAITEGQYAQQANDSSGALRAYVKVLNEDSQFVPPQTKIQLLYIVAQIYDSQQDYGNFSTWANKYYEAGGDNPELKAAMIGAYYQQQNFPAALKAAQKEALALIHSGKTSGDSLHQMLQIWESSAHNVNDDASFQQALLLIVQYFPTAQDWQNLLIVTVKKNNFPDRLNLDVERIEFQTGSLTASADLMTAAQDSLLVGLPGEAKIFLDAGFSSGVLSTGSDASRATRLKAKVDSSITADQRTLDTGAKAAEKVKFGDALVNVGFSYVMYGEYDQGIPLMEKGIAKGNLKHPGQSQLHLGIAYLKSGDTAKATAAFKAVDDTDGTPDLAKLWLLSMKKK